MMPHGITRPHQVDDVSTLDQAMTSYLQAVISRANVDSEFVKTRLSLWCTSCSILEVLNSLGSILTFYFMTTLRFPPTFHTINYEKHYCMILGQYGFYWNCLFVWLHVYVLSLGQSWDQSVHLNLSLSALLTGARLRQSQQGGSHNYWLMLPHGGWISCTELCIGCNALWVYVTGGNSYRLKANETPLHSS